MINYTDIEREIERLENEETNYNNCTKLAVLYTIADHNKHNSSRSVSYRSDTEFFKACEDADLDTVMRVIDEHFEAIKVLYPREYNSIIEKIKAP